MIHAVCFPSATRERGQACIKKWAHAGYKPVVLVDSDAHFDRDALYPRINGPVFMVGNGPFPGYYKVINAIVNMAFLEGADLVTCIGDDMDPPDQGAEAAAKMYFDRFPNGYGVMQPTGDPQGMDKSGLPASARICGSPVFGRGWFTRGYGGRGPFWDEYLSFYGDEDLHCYAEAAGLLWNNPELSHLHRHWSFGHMERQDYHHRAQRNWDQDYATFQRRQAAGFPGLVLT